MQVELQTIKEQVTLVANRLLEVANLREGDVFVLGCSSSEICGGQIGKASSAEVGQTVIEALLPILKEKGLYLAVQGCEHINRALCVSRACARQYGLPEVMVVPWLRAGGPFAAHAYAHMDQAVMVEDLRGQATLGMDIGGTLIGMHLRPVAVPIHTPLREIGEARVVMARTRPRYVGGPRARYE